jgi:hypothetical protein
VLFALVAMTTLYQMLSQPVESEYPNVMRAKIQDFEKTRFPHNSRKPVTHLAIETYVYSVFGAVSTHLPLYLPLFRVVAAPPECAGRAPARHAFVEVSAASP